MSSLKPTADRPRPPQARHGTAQDSTARIIPSAVPSSAKRKQRMPNNEGRKKMKEKNNTTEKE